MPDPDPKPRYKTVFARHDEEMALARGEWENPRGVLLQKNPSSNTLNYPYRLEHPVSGGRFQRLAESWKLIELYKLSDRSYSIQDVTRFMRAKFPTCADPAVTPARSGAYAKYVRPGFPYFWRPQDRVYNVFPETKDGWLYKLDKRFDRMYFGADGVLRVWYSRSFAIVMWPMRGFEARDKEGAVVYPYLAITIRDGDVVLELRAHRMPGEAPEPPEEVRLQFVDAFKKARAHFEETMGYLDTLENGKFYEAVPLVDQERAGVKDWSAIEQATGTERKREDDGAPLARRVRL